MKNVNKLMEKGGFSGVELTVSILVLMIFISLITVTFFNIYSVYTDSKRGSEATAYATQIMEQVQKMYYSEVTNSNLAAKVLEMNIPSGYGVQIQVESYNGEDLVKNVLIGISYKVGNQEKAVKFETVKSKEILITPNKPKLEAGMIPVKYIITDRDTNDGYWQITVQNDSTWYSYENKRWAAVMRQEGLTVEGGTLVTADNVQSLIGKKIENYNEILVWIPKYAYNEQNDIEFLYNITNKCVNESGDLQDIEEDYTIHSAFEEATGLWSEVYDDTRENVEAILESDTSALKQLIYSKYGDIINIIENKLW